MSEKTKIEHKERREQEPKQRSSIPVRVMKYVIAVVLVVVLVYFGFTTEVREGNCAVILQFGAVREEINEAGLYFRLPWPIETVVTYDDRLQYLESDFLETTTKDKRNVILQSYVIWEIGDPVLYHNSVGSQGKVDSYIKDQVFSATNSVLGAYDLTALVSLEAEQLRIDEIQEQIFARLRENCAKNYGINVTDVSILRLSLPDTNLQAVFEQMKADRQKAIDTILANAGTQANKITTDADIEASQIIANGQTAAAEIKAKTETEVARIYAEAQAANLELFQFLKNLDTTIASVGENTVLVVKADEYPFRVLTEYGDMLTEESDETVIRDLNYILTQLPEADRTALIDAIYALMAEAEKSGEAS